MKILEIFKILKEEMKDKCVKCGGSQYDKYDLVWNSRVDRGENKGLCKKCTKESWSKVTTALGKEWIK